MVFIKAAALLSLLSAVSAAPAAEVEARGTIPNSAFGFLALRSASPIHFSSLNANGGKIWLGKPTSTYCPVAKNLCPKGKDTSFWINNQYWTASMNAIVPGGQQLYIDPTGALSYTQAHSAFIPSGSITKGFQVKKEANDLYYLSHCEGGFLACPPNKSGTGPWKVFIDVKGKLKDKDVPSKSKNDCLGFNVAGNPVKDAVWQYA
ncbi:hypothetical protein H072_8746 [Dactylellina haptotyla CBS 200.50]|uniref:IgE-binding protein n=1 Tax=Dactylellina haptotyla (strain CBS 200.50) TaxID=1284197 RepID=S8A3H2_DACHA|nr:hypothetical protein H072_8746 [Dactylellina haptotyla CBS 200.50]